MKKYVLYNWHSDDGICGIGICYAKDFTTNIGYYGRSGWNSCPSHFLAGFNTVDEVIKYLYDVYNLYADEVEKQKKTLSIVFIGSIMIEANMRRLKSSNVKDD